MLANSFTPTIRPSEKQSRGVVNVRTRSDINEKVFNLTSYEGNVYEQYTMSSYVIIRDSAITIFESA